MKRTIKNLIGFTLGATDGEIGKVKDFYFDDHTWTIRYLIVDTGNWLTGRVVLIAPEALFAPDWENKIFPTNLSQEQIKNSPEINTKIPVSRQEELKLYTYYAWSAYWANTGVSTFDRSPPTIDYPVSADQLRVLGDDKHLRSTNQVTDYDIKAKDGEIGDVEDFIMDNKWKIKFVIIDTGKWFPGKKVLLPPNKIKEIDWDSGTVVINSTVEKIKQSPTYDPENEFTEVYSVVH